MLSCVILLVACGSQPENYSFYSLTYSHIIPIDNYTANPNNFNTIHSVPIKHRHNKIARASSPDTVLSPPPAPPPELIFNPNIEFDENTQAFAEIIAFYGELQQNAFNDYTREYHHFDGYLHPIAFRSIGGPPYRFQVVYAFYDITGNGLLDLIIGITNEEHSARGVYYINGIYTIVDGTPISVIQHRGGRRKRFYLLIDINGNIIIESTWGHGGSADEIFYTIDESGELLRLDWIATYDYDRDLWDAGIKTRPRIRHVDGYEVMLTAKEYIALMYEYGSMGYELFSFTVTEEIFMDWFRIYYPHKYEEFQGFGSHRRVNLDWEYILMRSY